MHNAWRIITAASIYLFIYLKDLFIIYLLYLFLAVSGLSCCTWHLR